MDLSEFFKTKEQNKNYVEYPPQESPSLDKFFAERAILNQPAVEKKSVAPNMFGGSLMPDGVNTSQAASKKTYIDPVSPEDKAAAVESDPLDDDRLNQIKLMYSQEMPMQQAVMGQQPQQPEQPQRSPANAYLDEVKNIREAVDANGYKLGAADLAPVIAPLLADLFTGGTGVSAGVVSGYLGDKLKGTEAKNLNLESKLLELAKSKALQKEKTRSGLSNEEWAARELFKAGLKKDLGDAKLSKEEQERIIKLENELSKEWRKDPFTRGTREVSDAYRRIMASNPDKGDPIEDMGLIFDLMKSLDPRSVVRESEQAMAMGARSYEDVVNNMTEMLSGKRKITPEQVRNIKKFASRLYSKRMESQQSIDTAFTKKAQKYGLDPQMIVEQMGDKTPILWTNRKTGKTDVILLPNDKVEAAIQAGAKRF